MTLPRAVVIAGAVFPTAYDSAFLMLDDYLASLVLEIAASASSWTSMTARQDRGARRCAFKAVLGDVDGAFDLDGVLTAWNFFRHNDITINAPKSREHNRFPAPALAPLSLHGPPAAVLPYLS
jgi:hypothetical protein